MIRLYINERLEKGLLITLNNNSSHYISNVMRCKNGDEISVFNGGDGEFLATITDSNKKYTIILVKENTKPQNNLPDIWLISALLRNSKTEFVTEKASELGVAKMLPVLTKYTVANKINETRLQAIATEAAEQCERLDIMQINSLQSLERVLGDWDETRKIIYGDETGKSQNANELLPSLTKDKYAVLIGPEGGFAPQELAILQQLPFCFGICLGPRIMRADTATIAALTLVQHYLGDWNEKPKFMKEK
jgi:16S rRNA (uracil1498-N3)-methyltransferase